jgi:primosomal protein N'
MELRTGSARTLSHPSLANACAQCGKALFMPNWSEYLTEHRLRHVWECEACGYKYETLVTFPEP